MEGYSCLRNMIPVSGPGDYPPVLLDHFLGPPQSHHQALRYNSPKLPLQFVCLPGGQIYGRYLYKYLYSAARRFWRTCEHTLVPPPHRQLPFPGQPKTAVSDGVCDTHVPTEDACPRLDRPTHAAQVLTRPELVPGVTLNFTTVLHFPSACSFPYRGRRGGDALRHPSTHTSTTSEKQRENLSLC